MINEHHEPVILAIESAVAGGSLSLLRGETPIAGRTDDGGVSRAEDLLPNIVRMLETAEIAKNDITKLAVSVGPGSYTGIRIGIATALGLKNSLQVPCAGVPVTEAMYGALLLGGDVVTAVPMGRNDVAYQEFGAGKVHAKPSLMTFEAFLNFARSNVESRIITETTLYTRLRGSDVDGSALADAGDNLAFYVGLAALRSKPGEDLEPLFVKAA